MDYGKIVKIAHKWLKFEKGFAKVNDLIYYLLQIHLHFKRRGLKDTAEPKAETHQPPQSQGRRAQGLLFVICHLKTAQFPWLRLHAPHPPYVPSFAYKSHFSLLRSAFSNLAHAPIPLCLLPPISHHYFFTLLNCVFLCNFKSYLEWGRVYLNKINDTNVTNPRIRGSTEVSGPKLLESTLSPGFLVTHTDTNSALSRKGIYRRDVT